MNQNKRCESTKSLFQLKESWLVIIVCLILTAYFSTQIYQAAEGLSWDGSGGQLSELVSLYSVPLTLLALIPALLTLIAANHRSKQTAKSIQLSLESLELTAKNLESSALQNTLANYYKHQEEFGKRLEHLSNQYDLTFGPAFQLYRKLFPNNSSVHVSLFSSASEDSEDAPYLEQCIARYHAIIQGLDKFDSRYKSPHSAETEAAVRQLYLDMVVLSGELSFRVNSGRHSWIIDMGISKTGSVGVSPSIKIAGDDGSPLGHLCIIREVLTDLMNFSHCDTELPHPFPPTTFWSSSRTIFGELEREASLTPGQRHQERVRREQLRAE